jgi:cobalt/nickel transport system permease protein
VTIYFTPFPESNSFIHRLDARWKLAALVPAAMAIVLVKSLVVAPVTLGCSLALVLISRLPICWYLKRMAGLALFFSLFVIAAPFLAPGDSNALHLGPISFSMSGLFFGLLTLTKALAISTMVLVVLASAPVDALFKAARSLHVPGILVQIGMMTYRYLFVLTSELTRMRIALRTRAYRNRLNRHSYRTIGNVAGTLLVRGYERSERVGQAMRCRGFDGQFRSLVDFRSRFADVAAFCMVLLIAGGLLAWDWSLR